MDASDSIESSSSLAGKSDKALLSDSSFWAILVTQFLGAFNDNLFKQLVLLLVVPVVLTSALSVPSSQKSGLQKSGLADNEVESNAAVIEQSAMDDDSVEATDNSQQDRQGWASAIFALPFVLFSGFAGFLSDKYRKTNIIIAAKIAEVVVMLLGVVAFYYYGFSGTVGLWTVLAFMGIQSTFFGPGKYGILPELFRSKDLPRANGLILMTTFLAIIFGVVAAGKLADSFVVNAPDGSISAPSLWKGTFLCVGIAVAGTLASLVLRRTPPALPDAKLSLSDWGIAPSMRQLLRSDRPLLSALLVSCVFWLVSGIAMLVVNRFGLHDLQLNKTSTSYLVACIGLGIMVGAIFANRLLKDISPAVQVRIGLFGIAGTLIILGFARVGDATLIGFWGGCALLGCMGISAAVFAIPVQVFLQDRPPSTLKGRMIATMNQANFVGILLSGPLYQLFESIAGLLGQPISVVFWMMAGVVLPLAIFYQPFAEDPSVPSNDAAVAQ